MSHLRCIIQSLHKETPLPSLRPYRVLPTPYTTSTPRRPSAALRQLGNPATWNETGQMLPPPSGRLPHRPGRRSRRRLRRLDVYRPNRRRHPAQTLRLDPKRYLFPLRIANRTTNNPPPPTTTRSPSQGRPRVPGVLGCCIPPAQDGRQGTHHTLRETVRHAPSSTG